MPRHDAGYYHLTSHHTIKAMTKDQIRRQIRAQKKLVDPQTRTLAAHHAFARLTGLAAFAVSHHILLYHALPDELDTISFLQNWYSRKNLYLPRVAGVNLELLPFHPQRLSTGAFGIEEPQPQPGEMPIDPKDIEMIVVPGVAFDEAGHRLGRGRGYYDRLLSSTRALKVGIGYDFQLIDQVPVEPHDISLDTIITPTRTIIVRQPRHNY